MDARRARLYLGYRAIGCSEWQAKRYAGFAAGPREWKCGCGSSIRRYSTTGKCRRCGGGSQRKTQREGEIVADHAAGNTLREIGTKFGISRERGRQILKRAGVPAMSAHERRARRHVITSVEAKRWKANYAKQKRLLLRRRAEHLYLSGMTMQQVAVAIGKRFASEAQRLLSGITSRSHGCYDRRTAGPYVAEIQRWDGILDGRIHEIPLGRRVRAWFAAAKRGKRVMVHKVDDETAIVLAYPPDSD